MICAVILKTLKYANVLAEVSKFTYAVFLILLHTRNVEYSISPTHNEHMGRWLQTREVKSYYLTNTVIG